MDSIEVLFCAPPFGRKCPASARPIEPSHSGTSRRGANAGAEPRRQGTGFCLSRRYLDSAGQRWPSYSAYFALGDGCLPALFAGRPMDRLREQAEWQLGYLCYSVRRRRGAPVDLSFRIRNPFWLEPRQQDPALLQQTRYAELRALCPGREEPSFRSALRRL